MKRIPVLALLLVFAPVIWAEEVVPTAEAVPLTEATDASAVTPAEPSATPEATPSETSTGTPVAGESTASSTVTPVSETPAQAAPAHVESAGSHKVVKGDTLWDLAGSYLKDPFQWTKIYNANKDKIENPRLIYPNQEFTIPTIEAEATLASGSAEEAPVETPAEAPKAEETPAAEAVTAPPPETPEPEVAEAPAQAEDMDAAGAPSKKMIEPVEDIVVEAPPDEDDKTQDEREAKKKRTMAVPGAGFMGGTADSFLADENWEYDGYVLRDRDQRMMISQGDVVFLNIGAASGVKPKMQANVYRVGKKVKDPYLKKKAGRMIKRVGSVIVTGQITDEGCTAVVTNSLEPIRIGDIVKFSAR